MKKSDYEKLTSHKQMRVWRGNQIEEIIGIRNNVIQCRINDHQKFTAEVLEEDGEKGYRINVWWNKKPVATTYTNLGYRMAGFLALGMLRSAMSAKASHHRWYAWEPEEEEVAK